MNEVVIPAVVILFATLIVDRVSKQWAAKWSQSRSYKYENLVFVSMTRRGNLLCLVPRRFVLTLWLSVCLLVTCSLVLAPPTLNPSAYLFAAMALGGALSNSIEWRDKGYITDIRFKGWRLNGNLADLAIIIGTAITLYYLLKSL